jgi:DNA-directed RNA polymerase specialized sigma24 family protein
MWFFDLIIIAVLFVIAYQVINRRFINNTGLKDLVKKYGDEINNVTVTFNRTAADNVEMLNLKIQEARETLRLLEKKGDEFRRTLAEYGTERKKLESRQREAAKAESQAQILGRLSQMISEETDPGLAERAAREKERKAKDKQTVILAYYGDGRSVQEIADKLDISQEEVRYYIKKENQV